ncbi:hypothetical protein M413DRAFT_194552 [Hebeloma cylindrosporum]|uniref:Uncharacterized protein n=1 Tax=Hebeloma cylindrosporum TaxID=76867 RepID=A0A0C2YF54_HEBCY|nr:hypothetical protein M413DRAFT_194552 [Hebeloma cylindrosporum h7]
MYVCIYPFQQEPWKTITQLNSTHNTTISHRYPTIFSTNGSQTQRPKTREGEDDV